MLQVVLYIIRRTIYYSQCPRRCSRNTITVLYVYNIITAPQVVLIYTQVDEAPPWCGERRSENGALSPTQYVLESEPSKKAGACVCTRVRYTRRRFQEHERGIYT